MKTLFITCAAVLNISFAQEYGMMDQDDMEHDNDKRRQRMESMMVWRLTEELEQGPMKVEFGELTQIETLLLLNY